MKTQSSPSQSKWTLSSSLNSVSWTSLLKWAPGHKTTKPNKKHLGIKQNKNQTGYHAELYWQKKYYKKAALHYSNVFNTTNSKYSHLTEHPCIVWRAFTNKAVQNDMAAAAILTRTTGTFVPWDFTVQAHKTWRTLTVVTSMNQLLHRHK